MKAKKIDFELAAKSNFTVSILINNIFDNREVR